MVCYQGDGGEAGARGRRSDRDREDEDAPPEATTARARDEESEPKRVCVNSAGASASSFSHGGASWKQTTQMEAKKRRAEIFATIDLSREQVEQAEAQARGTDTKKDTDSHLEELVLKRALEKLCKELVGWKVGLVHFNKQHKTHLEIGVFTAYQESLLSNTWLIKCVFEDMKFDWFEIGSVKRLIENRRLYLVEDCKCSSYEKRRKKLHPHEDVAIYRTPLGKACEGRKVRVWMEATLCFFPAVVAEWKRTTYAHGISSDGVETGRFLGEVKVVYFGKRSEWLSEDSPRIFWCNEEETKKEKGKEKKKDKHKQEEEEEEARDAAKASKGKGPAQAPAGASGSQQQKGRNKHKNRVGWKVVYVPDDPNQDVVMGKCILDQAATSTITIKPDIGETNKEVPERNALWLCGTVSNEEACANWVNSRILMYSPPLKKFEYCTIKKYDRDSGLLRVFHEKRFLVRDHFLPNEVVRCKNFSQGVQWHRDGNDPTDEEETCVAEKKHNFFGTLDDPGVVDAIGMKVDYLDMQAGHLRQGLVMDVRELPNEGGEKPSIMYQVLFHDCTSKWISDVSHTFEFVGEAGVFEYDYDSCLPFNVPVECNGVRAVFCLGRQAIMHEGSLLCPSKFEDLVGCRYKRWRLSIRIFVYGGHSTQSTRSINEFLSQIKCGERPLCRVLAGNRNAGNESYATTSSKEKANGSSGNKSPTGSDSLSKDELDELSKDELESVFKNRSI